MKTLIQKYIVVILAFLLGGMAVWYFTRSSLLESKKSESTTVIQEKLKTVTKLISVEGHFSEIYDYKESYKYDYFNLFSKKILLRVTAKVSVGYDFNNINITIDSLKKTVFLNELPSAEILSIDHDLDYYDITEGTFNSFTKEEFNLINKNAKAFIAGKSNTAQLIKKAEEEKQDYLSMMDFALRSAGWKLVVKDKTILD
ncbi:MAG: DUF4230 domain-containing protein [Chitinophagales bacterium]|nr:DUF4230 domain-containing protein [Chitinophagales bacterium]